MVVCKFKGDNLLRPPNIHYGKSIHGCCSVEVVCKELYMLDMSTTEEVDSSDPRYVTLEVINWQGSIPWY